jgi:hypothetical protein
MASVTNYMFDNMSRIGSDHCSQDQNTIQSMNACNYALENFFSNDCSTKQPLYLATTQPGIMVDGGRGSGANGCNIDDSSALLLGGLNTHPNCKIDLFQRPFATVPYVGRGSVCPVLEAQIQQGELLTNKKSVNRLPEKSYINYSNTPLLSDIKDRVTNPNFCVESVASKDWVRGGVASRELTRDKNTDHFNHINDM